MVGEIDANWNDIYNELLRWQTLLEATTLIKHIPYSYGTSMLYDDEQMTNETNQHNQRHTKSKEQGSEMCDNHQQEQNANAGGMT